MITSERIFNEQTQGAILHGLHWTASAIELLGVVVIVCGVLAATVWSLRNCVTADLPKHFVRIGRTSVEAFCSGWNS